MYFSLSPHMYVSIKTTLLHKSKNKQKTKKEERKERRGKWEKEEERTVERKRKRTQRYFSTWRMFFHQMAAVGCRLRVLKWRDLPSEDGDRRFEHTHSLHLL